MMLTLGNDFIAHLTLKELQVLIPQNIVKNISYGNYDRLKFVICGTYYRVSKDVNVEMVISRKSTNQNFHQITPKKHVDHSSTILVGSKEEENACSMP
jgi:hypothetical protein